VRATADPGRTFWPALFASEREDWATPPELVAGLEAEFGTFELDPCATPATAKAARFYTAEQDGLAQPWAPARVFLNPPYGRVIGAWMHKARLEAERGSLVVGLVHARTDTRWWHSDVEGHARLLRPLRGRVRFLAAGNGNAPAPFPSMIIVWGPAERVPQGAAGWVHKLNERDT